VLPTRRLLKALKLYEYQAREILQGYDSHIPRSITIFNADEAEETFLRLGQPRALLKAQILAGGRGKAGGVKIANSPTEAKDLARGLLGSKLVTPQTMPAGEEVKAILFQEVVPIERELYLSFFIDRQKACPLLMGCGEGGVEIEEVARRSPEMVLCEPWDSSLGLLPFQARKVAHFLGLSAHHLKESTNLILNLSKAFIEKDLTLLEINPLAVTPQGSLAVLDVKADFDDNAFFRHPEMVAIRPRPEESLESLASSFGLSYVGLEGDIGCLVNGAGLAMATNDILRVYGGRPANFLDVGGDASTERVAQAFSILLRDPRLRTIFVNIFGGITRCDTIAQAILEALKGTQLRMPMIIRMEGTNASEARRMLETSGLPFLFSKGMKESTLMAIEAAKTRPSA
jgi:succinyl-CoA synthetase beta subunit